MSFVCWDFGELSMREKRKKRFPVKKKTTKKHWEPPIYVKGLVHIRRLKIPLFSPTSFSKDGNYHFQWLLLHALLKVKKRYTKCLPLASNYEDGRSSDSVCRDHNSGAYLLIHQFQMTIQGLIFLWCDFFLRPKISGPAWTPVSMRLPFHLADLINGQQGLVSAMGTFH